MPGPVDDKALNAAHENWRPSFYSWQFDERDRFVHSMTRDRMEREAFLKFAPLPHGPNCRCPWEPREPGQEG
jgi:hypothetical protein